MDREEGPRTRGDRGAAARRGMEPEGGRQEAPDVRLASRGLCRVRGVAVREGHARAGALRQRLRDGGLPEDPPALRRLPDAPQLPAQEGGGRAMNDDPRQPIDYPCGGRFIARSEEGGGGYAVPLCDSHK